jgi:hypothetical protein
MNHGCVKKDNSKNQNATKGNKCKTNTIPILMHHMRISTNEVSSVVLSPKSWKSEKKM